MKGGIFVMVSQQIKIGHCRVLECSCQQIFDSMYGTEEDGLSKVHCAVLENIDTQFYVHSNV